MSIGVNEDELQNVNDVSNFQVGEKEAQNWGRGMCVWGQQMSAAPCVCSSAIRLEPVQARLVSGLWWEHKYSSALQIWNSFLITASKQTGHCPNKDLMKSETVLPIETRECPVGCIKLHVALEISLAWRPKVTEESTR